MASDSVHGGPILRGVIANACVSQPAELARPPSLHESAELLKRASVCSLTRHEPSPSGMDQANVVKRGTVKEFFSLFNLLWSPNAGAGPAVGPWEHQTWQPGALLFCKLRSDDCNAVMAARAHAGIYALANGDLYPWSSPR